MTDAQDAAEPDVPAQGTAGSPLLERIGHRLRTERRSQSLTVQELADRAGISRRALTQLEHGHGNPSLVTIDRLAHVLGLDFSAITAPEEPHDHPLTTGQAGAAVLIWSSPAGSSAHLLTSASRPGGAELWRWHLVPGDVYIASPDPANTEELFTVVSGTLTLQVAEDPGVDLPIGSFARLRSDRLYRYVNRGTDPVEFIRVVDLGPVARR